MNELKVGACINYIAIAFRLSTAFFLTPFILSCLGREEYGLFMLSNSIVAWLSLTDFGLGAAVTKYVSTYHARKEWEKEAYFLGQVTMLFSFLGLITLVAGLCCYWNLDFFFPNLTEDQYNNLEILYLLTLGNLILAFPMRPLCDVPGTYLKFIVPGMVTLILSVLNAGLTVLLLLWGYKAIALTVLSVTLGVARLIWGLHYTIRCLGVKIIFRRPDRILYREVFAFSFWALLNQLMDLFYWRSGAPVLARTSGPGAVTIFTLGISLPLYFMTASTAISSVIASKIMHMVALNTSREQLTGIMIRVGRLQLALLSIILIGFIVCGHDFLRLWVGGTLGEQTEMVWLGAILTLLPLLVPLTQNAGSFILQALNIHKGQAIILFYSSLLSVILGYFLSLKFGVIGIFISTSASLFIGQNLLINRYYAKKAGLHVKSFFRHTYVPLLLPAVLLGVVGGVVAQLVMLDTWGAFLTFAACYAIVCMVVLWNFYLKQEERDMFVIPLRRMIKMR